MGTFQILAGISLVAIAAPALADSCLPAWAEPPASDSGAYELVMTTLEPGGTANYARGPATYFGSYVRPPGVPMPARWATTTQNPADLYRDIDNSLSGLQPKPSSVGGYIQPTVSITVTATAIPVVTLRYLDTNPIKTQRLSASCSAGGVLHATSQEIDVLIYLRRPITVL